MARSFVGIGVVRLALLGLLALPACAVQDPSTASDPADSPNTDDTPPLGVVAHNKVKDPPPTCDDPRYVTYNSTTTVEDDQIYQTCGGYDSIGRSITCNDMQDCTRTDTWRHTFTCMNNGEYYLEHTTLVSSTLSCQASYYTLCPADFIEVGACWQP